MNIKTGIDLEKLLESVEIIKKEIKSDLSSHLAYVKNKCEA
jgi:hypothetical protein